MIKYNRLAQALLHVVFITICVLCLFPLFLVLGISFTDEDTISRSGFNLLPKLVSTEAYRFVLKESDAIGKAYLLTIAVTVVGTIVSTLVVALYAYPLARADFRWRKGFSKFVFFTMLFSGGLVPWYIICVQVLHLRNGFFALWLPYVMNAWYVMLMRTFYKENVPVSIIESARLDGAGEYTIFFRIVIYLAKPGIATIALFNTIALWNDWWLPLMLVSDSKWYNLQFLMYRVQSNIQYLSSMAGSLSGVSSDILRRLPSRTAQMAMCILVMGPIVLSYPFFQRYFVKGITVGSIKE
jgi:putative aldouronate transport system permease protein